MSLRFRLVLIPLLLVTLALGAIEAITYVKIKQTLIANVDGEMQSALPLMRQEFESQMTGGFVPAPSQSEAQNIQPFTMTELYSADGGQQGIPVVFCGAEVGCEATGQTGHPSTLEQRPYIPSSLVQSVASEPPNSVGFLTAGEQRWTGKSWVNGGGVPFRLLAANVDLQTTSGHVDFALFVAFPLTEVDATTSKIVGLVLVVGVFLLAAIAASSWFLVKLGLRPLNRMASTASDIAAGDLTRRVSDTDTRTEVGQLGAALNVMLAQIERAFTDKDASEEQLRRFIADASHELRTPLTSIRGYAELFRAGAADRPEDLAAALGRIESESVRMGGLVEDLLLLARLDQGRPLAQDVVDLTQLATDAILDASVVDQSRDIGLVAEQPCHVIGDEERLRQVLANLMSNAIKYSTPTSPIEIEVRPSAPEAITPTGGVPVTSRGRKAPSPPNFDSLLQGVSARPLGPGDFGMGPRRPRTSRTAPVFVTTGDAVEVSIVDHGPGIPAAERTQVFERFWRSDPSRKRTSGGNGLGLSIVAAVVAAHGGRVTVHETPGGGSTFLVRIPTHLPPPPLSNGLSTGESLQLSQAALVADPDPGDSRVSHPQ